MSGLGTGVDERLRGWADRIGAGRADRRASAADAGLRRRTLVPAGAAVESIGSEVRAVAATTGLPASTRPAAGAPRYAHAEFTALRGRALRCAPSAMKGIAADVRAGRVTARLPGGAGRRARRRGAHAGHALPGGTTPKVAHTTGLGIHLKVATRPVTARLTFWAATGTRFNASTVHTLADTTDSTGATIQTIGLQIGRETGTAVGVEPTVISPARVSASPIDARRPRVAVRIASACNADARPTTVQIVSRRSAIVVCVTRRRARRITRGVGRSGCIECQTDSVRIGGLCPGVHWRWCDVGSIARSIPGSIC